MEDPQADLFLLLFLIQHNILPPTLLTEELQRLTWAETSIKISQRVGNMNTFINGATAHAVAPSFVAWPSTIYFSL